MTCLRSALALILWFTLTTTSALAQPAVVPTAEGQIGETPGAGDSLTGTRFESIRGQPGDLVFGGILVPGGALPPPPEVRFLTDPLHGFPDPVPVGTPVPSPFANVEKVAPGSGWSRNAADDGDYVAFGFAVDGVMPDTITVRLATFDETGSSMVQGPIVEDVPTFTLIPDPRFARTGVGVDNQGRATVAYTELDAGLPRVKATRVNGVNGTIIDFDFLINDNIRGNPDVALLDPAGNRLIIASEELTAGPGIKGNIVDFTGATPVVLPEFPISSTAAAFGNINPAVAADAATGAFTVAWDHLTGVAGDPADVRARRFDAMGNPIGGDFRVNNTTANAQGQPTVTYGPAGLSAIAWAGDSTMPVPTLARNRFRPARGPALPICCHLAAPG